MSNLVIKPSTGKKWPDFFGSKIDSREKIEANSAVKAIISSNLLLKKELSQLLSDFTNNTKRICELIDKKNTGVSVLTDKETRETIISTLRDQIKTMRPEELNDEPMLNSLTDNIVNEVVRLKNKKIFDEATDISNTMQDQLDIFCTEFNQRSFNILNNLPIYFCKDCYSLIQRENFRSVKCLCGKNIKQVKETFQVNIRILDRQAVHFFERNMWLEYGAEKLFIRAGYATECGVYILGSSGVRHEIDVIGENSSTHNRVLAECKNRSINLDDIFKLFGKMSDLGCYFGFFFTTVPHVAPDVIRLANAKNIRIITDFITVPEDDVVNILSRSNPI